MMKTSSIANIGLILGIILLLGLLVVPVSAIDDTSWFQPAPMDDIMAWFKTSTQNVWVVPGVPADNTGAFPVNTPSYTPSDIPSGDSAWFIPASPDQVVAWGKLIAKENAATAYPTTFSQAERIRLFRSYTAGGYTPILPTPTGTSVPTTQPVIPSGTPAYHNPIRVPAIPYYIPSIMPTVFPTQAPATGGTAPGQTGIYLSELNLPGKYVRITNTGTTPVVMTGWKITNSRGNALTFIDFPLGSGTTFTYVLYPYSTLTVFFGKEGMVSASELYYPDGGGFWNPQGDIASLYNPTGQLVGRISA